LTDYARLCVFRPYFEIASAAWPKCVGFATDWDTNDVAIFPSRPVIIRKLMPRKSEPPSPQLRKRFQLFAPILAGATLGDRLVACNGALIGIALTGLLCGLTLGNGVHLPLLVAPMGASAKSGVSTGALPS
jgi:hypothetical protein